MAVGQKLNTQIGTLVNGHGLKLAVQFLVVTPYPHTASTSCPLCSPRNARGLAPGEAPCAAAPMPPAEVPFARRAPHKKQNRCQTTELDPPTAH